MKQKILDIVNAMNDTRYDMIETAIHAGLDKDVLICLLDHLEEKEEAELRTENRNFFDKYGGQS